MLSVGIDIGTSTTQLVFSQLVIQNTANMVTIPCIKIVDKKVVYRSDIHFTPLRSITEIDVNGVRELIEAEYKKAGVKPSDVDTGAVIITGETARKENAREVLKVLSGLAGDFVVATAGPALEGIIAGKGANAAKLSKDRSCTVANLDIGGGTTNIAVFKNGDVIDTACLDIGGRLIKLDGKTGEVLYASDKIKQLAKSIGITIVEGRVLVQVEIELIAKRMAQILGEIVGVRPKTTLLDVMATDHDLRRDYGIDIVTYSGGVADCVHMQGEDNLYRFGDIGIVLGQAIAKSGIDQKVEVLTSKETIRATVIGAGTHTTDISGSTITFDEKALPLKNIPILKLTEEDEALPLHRLRQVIADKLKWFQLESDGQQVALAFRGQRSASFQHIIELSQCIIQGMTEVIKKDEPLVIIVENDMAKVLGQTLKAHLHYKKDVVCIDSVQVDNGDYIDIGHSIASGNVVPVIVKTLLLSY